MAIFVVGRILVIRMGTLRSVSAEIGDALLEYFDYIFLWFYRLPFVAVPVIYIVSHVASVLYRGTLDSTLVVRGREPACQARGELRSRGVQG